MAPAKRHPPRAASRGRVALLSDWKSGSDRAGNSRLAFPAIWGRGAHERALKGPQGPGGARRIGARARGPAAHTSIPTIPRHTARGVHRDGGYWVDIADHRTAGMTAQSGNDFCTWSREGEGRFRTCGHMKRSFVLRPCAARRRPFGPSFGSASPKNGHSFNLPAQQPHAPQHANHFRIPSGCRPSFQMHRPRDESRPDNRQPYRGSAGW
nr:hypothetical protein RKHAN_00317 [Rhizobium sp. Khangiran2]